MAKLPRRKPRPGQTFCGNKEPNMTLHVSLSRQGMAPGPPPRPALLPPTGLSTSFTHIGKRMRVSFHLPRCPMATPVSVALRAPEQGQLWGREATHAAGRLHTQRAPPPCSLSRPLLLILPWFG
eukprot:358578-Chlamydomonas_euryale.AAC.6